MLESEFRKNLDELEKLKENRANLFQKIEELQKELERINSELEKNKEELEFNKEQMKEMQQNKLELEKEIKNLEREKFIKDFLTEKVLVLWPDGWMSLNILYNRYISFRNQASPSNRSNESVGMVSSGIKNNQNSPNNPNVINISSKNGKTVRIEAQNVNQTQTGIFEIYLDSL